MFDNEKKRLLNLTDGNTKQARRGAAGHESQRSAQVDSDGDYDNSPASGSVSLYA